MELKFSGGKATTESIAAAEYCKELGYSVEPDPYKGEPASNDPPPDGPTANPKLAWCIQRSDGEVLSALNGHQDGEQFIVESFAYTNDPGLVIGFRIKKDAEAFLAEFQMDEPLDDGLSLEPVKLPDGFAGYDAPTGATE
tara:strand:+ start:9053 stop:9472 length:420 start_codon:yes stop_codon:yes gene_type:complete